MASQPLQPAERRRLQYREDARRSILDAAEGLLVESGLDGFSMRRLAERCGYTAPTLYHYFRDKLSLVDALLDEWLQQLAGELRAVPLSDDAAANVRALGASFARFGLRNPSLYQLLVMNHSQEAEERPGAEDVQRIFGDALDAMVHSGVLREAEREGLRQGVWSLLHGVIVLQTTRPDEEWVPDLLERSLESIVRGWLDARRAPEPK